MLIKIPDASGGYRYAFPKETWNDFVARQVRANFPRTQYLSINASENLVVIRTLPGTAQAVAYGVDYMKMAGSIRNCCRWMILFLLL